MDSNGKKILEDIFCFRNLYKSFFHIQDSTKITYMEKISPNGYGRKKLTIPVTL